MSESDDDEVQPPDQVTLEDVRRLAVRADMRFLYCYPDGVDPDARFEVWAVQFAQDEVCFECDEEPERMERIERCLTAEVFRQATHRLPPSTPVSILDDLIWPIRWLSVEVVEGHTCVVLGISSWE